MLLSEEEAFPLRRRFESQQSVMAREVLELDIPAKARVDSLLRYEFLRERELRRLACDFAEHTLHIFSYRCPEDDSVRKCLAAARSYATGTARLREVSASVGEAIRAVWKLEGTPYVSAFEAGLAVTFLDYKDAAELARVVAVHTQRAAHRRAWETRKSNVQPITAREEEAAWQLSRIVNALISARVLKKNYPTDL